MDGGGGDFLLSSPGDGGREVSGGFELYVRPGEGGKLPLRGLIQERGHCQLTVLPGRATRVMMRKHGGDPTPPTSEPCPHSHWKGATTSPWTCAVLSTSPAGKRSKHWVPGLGNQDW